MTHFCLLSSLIESSTRWKWTGLRWDEREREERAAYYATLRRELQHVACSTKQRRLRYEDSAARTRLVCLLFYLHEVHQFKSEIINTAQNILHKQTKTSIQSCRKRRDRERAEEEARDAEEGGRTEGKVFMAFCLSAHEKYTENILELHFSPFLCLHLPPPVLASV